MKSTSEDGWRDEGEEEGKANGDGRRKL